MTKRNNEALYHYQQELRRYCDKQMISTAHLVRIMSILCKAWNTALRIGFEEGIKGTHEPSVEIRDEMDADMEDSGMAQGEIESCLNHWSHKYVIQRKEKNKYHLNCKKCGKAYWCAIAFPVDQLCENCIGEDEKK